MRSRSAQLVTMSRSPAPPRAPHTHSRPVALQAPGVNDRHAPTIDRVQSYFLWRMTAPCQGDGGSVSRQLHDVIRSSTRDMCRPCPRPDHPLPGADRRPRTADPPHGPELPVIRTTKGLVHQMSQGGRAQDACKYSPARVPEAITVGATDKTDTKAGSPRRWRVPSPRTPRSRPYGPGPSPVPCRWRRPGRERRDPRRRTPCRR